jgi:hypothetical protein
MRSSIHSMRSLFTWSLQVGFGCFNSRSRTFVIRVFALEDFDNKLSPKDSQSYRVFLGPFPGLDYPHRLVAGFIIAIHTQSINLNLGDKAGFNVADSFKWGWRGVKSNRAKLGPASEVLPSIHRPGSISVLRFHVS